MGRPPLKHGNLHHGHDPWPDQRPGPESHSHPDRNTETDPDAATANQQVALRFAAIFGICLLLVSGLPGPLVPVVLSSLLMFASFGSALIAAFRQERFWAPVLTHWDEAAAFWVAGFMSKCLIDAAAVEAIVQSAGPAG